MVAKLLHDRCARTLNMYDLPPGADPDRVLAQLVRDPRVESAQPLQSFATLANPYNDPYSTLQYNVAQMAVAQAHALSRGANVRVAVIDAGVALDHPDLPGNFSMGIAPHVQLLLYKACWRATVASTKVEAGAAGWTAQYLPDEYRLGHRRRCDRKRPRRLERRACTRS